MHEFIHTYKCMPTPRIFQSNSIKSKKNGHRNFKNLSLKMDSHQKFSNRSDQTKTLLVI